MGFCEKLWKLVNLAETRILWKTIKTHHLAKSRNFSCKLPCFQKIAKSVGFYEKPSKFTNLAETSNFSCKLPCVKIFKFSAKRLQKGVGFYEKLRKLIDFAETRILWKTIKTVIKTPKSAGHRYSHSRRGQKRPRRNISSKPWSSQLRTQFKQLRIEAWKSQDFNGVWTFQIRSSIYETFHISLHKKYFNNNNNNWIWKINKQMNKWKTKTKKNKIKLASDSPLTRLQRTPRGWICIQPFPIYSPESP